MNPQLKWPLACAGTLAAGWLIGYVMGDGGGAAAPGGKGAASSGAHSAETIALAPAANAVIPQDLPKATAEEERHSETSILSALRETNDLRRMHDLYDVIGKMSPGEVSSAISLAQRMTGQDRDTLLPMLVGKWAETDPQAAVKFALGLDRNARFGATRAAMNIWAASDPQAAMAWAQALPPGDQRNSALYGLVATVAKRDPAAAMQFIATLPKDQFLSHSDSNIFKPKLYSCTY